MPNAPRTKHRTIRVHDDVWNASQARAKEDGITVTDYVTRCLEEWTGVQRPPAEPRARRRGGAGHAADVADQ